MVTPLDGAYVYVDGQPSVAVDPLGLCRFCDWLGVHGPEIPHLREISDATAGFGDHVSFGLTRKFRQWVGTDDVVSTNSVTYGAGGYVGWAVDVATGALGATKLALTGCARAYQWFQAAKGGAELAGADGSGLGRLVRAVRDERGSLGGGKFHPRDAVPAGADRAKWNFWLWGRAAEGARERIGRSATELREMGMTVEKARQLRDFYLEVAARGKGGDAAPARAELMEDIIRTLGG
jgi:hypothetical protein